MGALQHFGAGGLLGRFQREQLPDFVEYEAKRFTALDEIHQPDKGYVAPPMGGYHAVFNAGCLKAFDMPRWKR